MIVNILPLACLTCANCQYLQRRPREWKDKTKYDESARRFKHFKDDEK